VLLGAEAEGKGKGMGVWDVGSGWRREGCIGESANGFSYCIVFMVRFWQRWTGARVSSECIHVIMDRCPSSCSGCWIDGRSNFSRGMRGTKLRARSAIVNLWQSFWGSTDCIACSVWNLDLRWRVICCPNVNSCRSFSGGKEVKKD
jgi:hypothetical protein